MTAKRTGPRRQATPAVTGIKTRTKANEASSRARQGRRRKLATGIIENMASKNIINVAVNTDGEDDNGTAQASNAGGDGNQNADEGKRNLVQGKTRKTRKALTTEEKEAYRQRQVASMSDGEKAKFDRGECISVVPQIPATTKAVRMKIKWMCQT